MATKSRRAFDKHCSDIDQLLTIHQEIGGTNVGRRQLEVLNKSAIVLLTAFWEAYCEDLAAEALQHLVKHAPAWSAIPKELKKRVAKALREDLDELAVWRLAGRGWRTVLTERLEGLTEERNRKLNTPKTTYINELFLKALGIEVSDTWHWSKMPVASAAAKLDKYVELRGNIAHRGQGLKSVRKEHVREYYEHLKRLVGKTGGRVSAVVKQATGRSLL